jgi:hypothetical protein
MGDGADAIHDGYRQGKRANQKIVKNIDGGFPAICWPSMQPSKRRGPGRPVRALPWWQTRCGTWH